MGSNTFRLVVFRYRPGGSFQLVDEIRDAVRLSAGAGPRGLRPEAVARAERAARLYAAFCRETGIEEVDALATSAVRDAANQKDVLRALGAGGALPVRVLSAGEEAWYGYLGAVNSTTLGDGHVIDLGGGSAQITEVRGRRLERSISRPLGAVRMTEAFLPGQKPSRGQMKALRRHVAGAVADAGWIRPAGGRAVGIGGTIRTLAAMDQRRSGYPLDELHGYRLRREAVEALVAGMAALPARERSRIPGLKPDRADITLAGAIVVSELLGAIGADEVEVCAQGLREGVFYERFLAPADPPLIPDVRRQSVMNLVAAFRCDVPHAEHVAALATGLYDELARIGLQGVDRRERELLWAAGMLHDAGVLVDYNDHHKHGHYLVLNAGLPGFDHAELALIALLVRGHRKALPTIEGYEDVLGRQDAGRLDRLAACLRVAEQLERGRARGVREVRAEARDGVARLLVRAEDDPTVALWSAGLEAPAFERAFGRGLELAEA